MKNKKVLPILFLLLLNSSLVFSQTNQLTLTTYYPSPFGVYRKMSITNSAQFTPLAAAPSNCTTAAEAGLMYFDNTTRELRVCDGTQWSSSGVWIDNFTTLNIYPRNYTNRNVGVGISAPTTRLEVSKDITGATWAAMFAGNPFNSQLTLSDTSGRMYLGDFYNPGIATMGVLQASDYWSAADHWMPLLLNPNGGSVGVGINNPGYKLDVGDRMRVRQGAGTAGIWFYQTTPAADRAFVGMAFDDYVGFWGNTGAGFSFVMNTTTGNVGVGTVAPEAKLQIGVGTTAANFAYVLAPPPADSLLVRGAVILGRNEFFWGRGMSTIEYPAYQLDLAGAGAVNRLGTVRVDSFQLFPGAAAGRVLVSDAVGHASWGAPSYTHANCFYDGPLNCGWNRQCPAGSYQAGYDWRPGSGCGGYDGQRLWCCTN